MAYYTHACITNSIASFHPVNLVAIVLPVQCISIQSVLLPQWSCCPHKAARSSPPVYRCHTSPVWASVKVEGVKLYELQ